MGKFQERKIFYDCLKNAGKKIINYCIDVYGHFEGNEIDELFVCLSTSKKGKKLKRYLKKKENI